MWKNLKIEHVGAIEKCVAEFQIWAPKILPYAKMKIKIYERQDSYFIGFTNINLIRKYDNCPEGATGYGNTIEEALADTVNYFWEMVKEDYPENEYPNGLSEEHIEYTEFGDF